MDMFGNLTTQDVFDKVANHLLTQNEIAAKRKEGGYDCKYRLVKDDKILKCAVGCLIPDELYNERIEGKNLKGLISAHMIPEMCDFFAENEVLLRALQSIHDNDNPSEWQEKLNILAKMHSLLPYPRILEIRYETD